MAVVVVLFDDSISLRAFLTASVIALVVGLPLVFIVSLCAQMLLARSLDTGREP